jgi:hypothetical protein
MNKLVALPAVLAWRRRPFVVDLLATVPEGRRIGVFAMSPAFPLLLQEAALASEGRMRLAASESFPWLAQAGLATVFNRLLELAGEEFAVTAPLDEGDVLRAGDGRAVTFAELQAPARPSVPPRGGEAGLRRTAGARGMRPRRPSAGG